MITNNYYLIPIEEGCIIKKTTQDDVHILGTPNQPIIFPTIEFAFSFLAQEIKQQAPIIFISSTYGNKKPKFPIEINRLLEEFNNEWKEKRKK